MKHFYILIFLFSSVCFAQPPAGYYDSAIGTGYTLKTQLKEIINSANDGLGTEYFHNPQAYDDLYTGYISTDSDSYYENDGTVLDIYSEDPSGADAYNYNHVIGDQCGNYNSEADC